MSGRLRMVQWLETTAIHMDSVRPDPVRRLAALARADAESTATLVGRLRLSNRDADRLIGLCAAAELTPEAEQVGLDRALYFEGAERARDRVLLSWAGEMADDPHHTSARTRQWIAMLEAAESWTKPRFPIGGRDVTALGVPLGPAVGALLESTEGWWLEGGFAADREACLSFLKSRLTATPPSAEGT